MTAGSAVMISVFALALLGPTCVSGAQPEPPGCDSEDQGGAPWAQNQSSFSCGPGADGVPSAQWTRAGGHARDIQSCTLTLMRSIDRRFCRVEAALGPAACETKPAPADRAAEGEDRRTGTGKLFEILNSRTTDLRSALIQGGFGGTPPDLICNQMRLDRAAWGAVVERRLAATVGDASADGAQPYENMYEAANDLFAYDRAGSVAGARTALANRTAAKAHACGNGKSSC